jgi:hypothetical protein
VEQQKRKARRQHSGLVRKELRIKRARAREAANKLLKSPYFFNEFLSAVRKAGLAGEENNALVVLVVLVSRLLPAPLHLFVKGRSSAGKNYLVKTVLRLAPKDAISEITSFSDQAWYYAARKVRHTIIFLQEQNEAAGNLHPLRLLISEGKLVREVTVREGNKWVTKTITVRGPVASASTTTKPLLKLDDENRAISIRIDESAQQTRRIVKAYARESKGLSDHERLTWRMVHRCLERRIGTKIAFPEWFAQVAEKVNADDLRVRRYWPAFVEACRTICLIRSFQDERE